MGNSLSLPRLFGVATAAVLLSTSLYSSSYADEQAQGNSQDLPEVGQSGTNKSDWGDSTATVNKLVKAEGNGYTSLTWTVTNDGGSEISIRDFRNTVFDYEAEGLIPISGVALVDNGNDIRYYPSKDSENECLCTGPRQPNNLMTLIDDGESATLWNAYDLREETKTVDVEIPGFKPITGLDVG